MLVLCHKRMQQPLLPCASPLHQLSCNPVLDATPRLVPKPPPPKPPAGSCTAVCRQPHGPIYKAKTEGTGHIQHAERPAQCLPASGWPQPCPSLNEARLRPALMLGLVSCSRYPDTATHHSCARHSNQPLVTTTTPSAAADHQQPPARPDQLHQLRAHNPNIYAFPLLRMALRAQRQVQVSRSLAACGWLRGVARGLRSGRAPPAACPAAPSAPPPACARPHPAAWGSSRARAPGRAGAAQYSSRSVQQGSPAVRRMPRAEC